ncbi:MAG: hypothetical protein M1835_005766 [Candelina submexicana]|nr:MAG: hypothetical protein M1835_005766 [Candelina submexicana]
MDAQDISHVPQPVEMYTWLDKEYEHEVSEQELLQISKDFSIIPTRAKADEHIAQQLSRVLKVILKTAASAHISQSHRAAASNALCRYLEKCSSYPDQSINKSSPIKRQWMDLFNIYVAQSVNSKSKPMKQVLATLSAALRRGLDPADALLLRDRAISRLIGIVWSKEAYSRVKPALQALAFFVAKRVILIQDLMIIFHSWFEGRTSDQEDNGVLQAPKFEDAENPRAVFNQFWDTSVVTFILNSLRWLSHHDLAPAAGQFASIFFQELHEQASGGLKYRHSSTQLPLWVEVVQQNVLHDSNVLENYKYHVLPTLFRLNASDFQAFLKYLGLRDLCAKSSLSALNPSAMLLYASLQVGKALGMVREEGPQLEHDKLLEAGFIALPNTVLDKLLIDPYAATRCSALSILTTSTSNTKPFSADVLSILELRLPQLHAESDARFRNEILSTEQQLIDRLRGASSHLTRESARQEAFINRKKQSGPTEKDNASDSAEMSIDVSRSLDRHINFLNWYAKFLVSELRPTASYQRHICALKALGVLLRSGLDDQVDTKNLSRPAQGDAKWSIHVRVYDAYFVRTLSDLLLNPFDDVRDSAAILLKVIPATYTYLWQVRDRFLGRAQSMYQRSGRADHADGVARGFEILYSLQITNHAEAYSATVGMEHVNTGPIIVEKLVLGLEENLVIASRNLTLAVSAAPIHGEFASVRSIFDRAGFYSTLGTVPMISLWRSLHQRLIRCCETLWERVRYVLCNDSPEGFLLEDAEPEMSVGTKDILSWAWRALKEASILLRVIVAKATHGSDNKTSILKSTDIQVIGSLTFKQLTQLRHRGAFSVVSSTFAACCHRCSNSKDAGLAQLPALWYRETLLRIQDQGASFTRRSAGIPSLVMGVLLSDNDGHFVKIAISELQKEACRPVKKSKSNEEIELPQVHALNCLKAIFTNTKLAEYSDSSMSEALRLAIACFGSDEWAIRNCGMMLLQALIDRLCGVGRGEDKTYKTIDVQVPGSLYESYPELTGLLLEVLGTSKSLKPAAKFFGKNKDEERGASTRIEAVFPALEIVQRAGLPPGHAEEVTKLVLRHLGSRAWQIRVTAARTLSVILSGQPCTYRMSLLLDEPWASTNTRHGKLLCTKIIMREFLESLRASSSGKTCLDEFGKLSVLKDLREVTGLLQHWYHNVFVHDNCPYTKSAFLDIIKELAIATLQNGGLSNKCSPQRALRETWLSLYDMMNGGSCSQRLGEHYRTSSRWASAPLFRRANACLTSLKYCLEYSNEDIGVYLTTLICRDSDSACGVMDMLGSLIDCVAEPSSKLVATTFADVMEKGTSANVRTTAATNLANLLEHKPHLAAASLLHLKEHSAIPLLENPLANNAHLRLRGFALTLEPVLGSANTKETARNVSTLSLMLKLAGDDKKDFPTRYAAVQSLHAVKPDALKLDPSFLSLLLILYNTLLDDDEDVRNKGAEVASTWLRKEETLFLTPIAARAALLEVLACQYADSRELCLEALRRLAAPQPFASEAGKVLANRATVYLHPAELLFETAMEEDTSLFVEEKQNLFVDEAEEVESWSYILRRCCCSARVDDVRVKFEPWTRKGLSIILENVKTKVDGPLGWTSKPEIFLLGMRFILGADVIMHWAASDRIGISGWSIRTTLEEIASHGRRNAMNGFWQRRLDSILNTSV